MNRFTRFIFILLGSSIALAIVILLLGNVLSQQREAQNIQRAKDTLRARVEMQSNRLVRAEMAVVAQQIAGDGNVISTTLAYRPYLLEPGDPPRDDKRVPMPVTLLTIPGDKVRVGAVVVAVKEATGETAFLNGLSIPLLLYAYSPGTTPTDGHYLPGNGQSPSLLRENPQRQTPFERQVWQEIAESIRDPKRAQIRGMHVTWQEPAEATIKPGMLYSITLGRTIGLDIEPVDDPRALTALRAAIPTDQDPQIPAARRQ